MDENDCPKCFGKGKVQEMQAPDGRFAPIAAPKFIKCQECAGSGKRRS